MQSKPKSNSVCTTTIDPATGIHTYTVLGAGVLTFDPKSLTPECALAALNQGCNQKIVNSAALSCDTVTGKSAAAAAKFAAIKATIDRLSSGGAWNAPRGGPSGPDAGLIVAGMIRAGLVADVDAANAALTNLATARGIPREAALSLFADSKEVATATAAIRAERATARAAAAPITAAGLMAEAAGAV